MHLQKKLQGGAESRHWGDGEGPMASHGVELKAAELTKPKSVSKDTCKDTVLEEKFYERLVFIFQPCYSEFLLVKK